MKRIPLKEQRVKQFSLTDTKFKKNVMKILKELRKTINRNADYHKKELETMRRSQEKLENLLAKEKADH